MAVDPEAGDTTGTVSGGVAVLTDSTACLPPDRVGAPAGPEVIPLHVHVGGRGRLSDREIAPEEVADTLVAGKERVTTSRPSPGEFVAVYRELAARRGVRDIVSVHLSGAVSGTVEAAELARDELAGELSVTVVDTRNVGMAVGYAALAAAACAAGGADADRVARVATERAAAGRIWFYVDTLEHLRRGGRIGRAASLAGAVLAIKPLLTLKDGEVGPAERVRTRQRALARLVDHVVEAVEEARESGAEVDVALHELAAAEAAEDLASRIRERCGAEPEIVELDAVIGTHTGPGTLGVVVSPRI